MLGEAPIEARSVFDYLSTKSKERLVQATARKIAPPIVDKTRLQVTLVPKDAAKLALQGFIPFGDTPEKQARYRHFLEASLKTLDQQNDPTNLATTFDIPAGMTYESGMKELDEFSKAARIFRPISSMMSGRFTSSSSLSTGSTSSGTVEHVSFEGGLKTEEQWKKDKEIREKQIVDEPKPKVRSREKYISGCAV
jgi:G patch domain-containing protein 1